MLAIEIPVDPGGLEAAQDRIEAYLAQQGAAQRVRYKVRLILDELMANLILHGRFAGPALPARVEVSLGAAGVALAFEDAAAAFDPRGPAGPIAPARLDDDRVGGLGLPLVRRMADILDYRRLPSGWNRTEFAITAA